MSTQKRPSCYSNSVDTKVANALLPRVLNWLQQKGDDIDDETSEDVLKQLIEVVDCNDNGYSIARALDSRYMWDVDSDLVSLLDQVPFLRHKAHESDVEAWVVLHCIRPIYSVGNRVTFKRRPSDKETISGEVMRVLDATAQYVVFCESLGHVRTGPGSLDTYVAFEDVVDKECV